jgi:hypothetical protein
MKVLFNNTHQKPMIQWLIASLKSNSVEQHQEACSQRTQKSRGLRFSQFLAFLLYRNGAFKSKNSAFRGILGNLKKLYK